MTREVRTIRLEPFGAELDVAGHDVLDPVVVDALRRALARHDWVLLRGPRLALEEQIRLCSGLGPVLMSDVGEVTRETAIGLGGAELCFHSDYGYSPEPLQAISLHAIEVEDGRTATRFASGRCAWDALDEAGRRRLRGLRTLQVFGQHLDRRNRRSELAPGLPATEHPLVWPHEATGGHFLFAPEMTTDSIAGLDAEESEALIADLFDRLYAPAHVLEHRWTTGDLVIWRNVVVTHARDDVSRLARRVLQRVTLGTKGYLDLYPELATHGFEVSGGRLDGQAFARERSR
jgi:taurine dioxygenase